MPRIKDANGLTTYAIKVLKLAGYFCWRQNNGAIWDAQAQAYRRNPQALLGVSDILGYHKTTGRFLACEIKAGRDRISPDQQTFLDGVAAAGGISLVVRHADDLKSFLPQ